MRDKTKLEPLQFILKTACTGTSVTTRDLIKELTKDDLADIKNGYMTANDLTDLVMELADNKDNKQLYRVKAKDLEY